MKKISGKSVFVAPLYQVGFPKGMSRKDINKFFPEIAKVLDELNR